MSEEKKVDVVEEKEVKKSAKKSEEVKAEVKVEEPKKEVKAEVKTTNVKKEFVVGAKVIDRRKKEYVIHEVPAGQLEDQSDIVISCNDVLSVQVKGKLQLV